MDNNLFEKQYKQLNPKQKEAVDTIEGPVMVIAGPGTGKTTILTLRIANILQKTDIQPENILALTFTESGVFSMRKKLSKVIGSTAHKINIFTFHGFCNYLIEQYPENYEKIISAKPVSNSDQIRLIEKIILEGDYDLVRPLGDPTYYVMKIKSAISHLKKEGFTFEEYKDVLEKRISDIEDDEELINKKTGKLNGDSARELKKIKRSLELNDVYKKYQEQLVELKFFDFDDMILETLEAFDKDPDFLLEQQEKFQYLLADEHQDTNHAQNKILEMLADFHDSPNIFIVGDEKQAIFRFQGASLDNFLYFKDKFKDTKIIQLEDNYRSNQNILDNAFELISKNETDESLNIKLKSGANLQEDKIKIKEFKNYNQEIYGITNQISELVSDGVDPNEIAIIYRKNSDSSGISKMLESKKIPHFINSKQNITDSDDILRIKILLNAINDPLNNINLISFLNLDFINLLLSDIYTISKKIRDNKNIFELLKELDEDSFEDFGILKKNISKLENFYKQSKSRNGVQIFEEVVNDFGLVDHILSSENSVERMSVINKVYSEFKKNSATKNNYLVSDFIEYLKTLEAYNIDLETYINDIEDGVSLMTAHGSKGLEYDYVFVINGTQKDWGKASSRSYFELPYVNSEVKNNQSLEDERRLFYVAITRARKSVSISYSELNNEGKENDPSQFIDELKDGLVDLEKIKPIESTDIVVELIKPRKNSTKITNKKYIKKIFLETPMSVTALNNYLECPWRYFYSNLIRIPIPTTQSLAFGNAIHATFKWYMDNLKDSPEIDTVKIKFDESLAEQNIDKESFNTIKKESEEILPGYFETFLKDIDRNKEYLTEYSISDYTLKVDDTNEIRLKGNLDRIDLIDDKEVKVVDYKTTKPKSENDIKGKTQNSDGSYYRQLIFYKMLIENHKDWKMKEAELSFVKPNDKGDFISRVFVISDDEVIDLINEIKRVSKEIINGEFLDKKCDKQDCHYCRMVEIFN
jgi:DNA helicase-2/ATP-dependent DNA helicase PcrA